MLTLEEKQNLAKVRFEHSMVIFKLKTCFNYFPLLAASKAATYFGSLTS